MPSAIVIPVQLGPGIESSYDNHNVIRFITDAIGRDRIDKDTFAVFDETFIFAWVSDLSAIDDSPVNELATQGRDEIRLLQHAMGPHPIALHGTVVITACDRESGENVDLPGEFLDVAANIGWITQRT